MKSIILVSVMLVVASGAMWLWLRPHSQEAPGRVAYPSTTAQPKARAVTQAQCDRAEQVLAIAWDDEIPEREWTKAFAAHARRMADSYEAVFSPPAGALASTPPAPRPDAYERAVIRYIHEFDSEYVEWVRKRGHR